MAGKPADARSIGGLDPTISAGLAPFDDATEFSPMTDRHRSGRPPRSNGLDSRSHVSLLAATDKTAWRTSESLLQPCLQSAARRDVTARSFCRPRLPDPGSIPPPNVQSHFASLPPPMLGIKPEHWARAPLGPPNAHHHTNSPSRQKNAILGKSCVPLPVI